MAKLSIFENFDIVLEQGSDLINFYRSDPIMAAYELLKVDLAPIQRVILRDMWFKNYVITVAGRGCGKTFLLGVNATLHALLYPGYRIGLIAPSFRQSKLVFAEVEKLYQRSSIVREACAKKPVRGADNCSLQFKGTSTSNGSYIEALPIGVDGAKIRGSRFYLVEIDELAQMPPDIIDMVIRPMGAVHLEPMLRVREQERQHELIRLGLASEDDFEDTAANKMIMTSSGYFKFNHMWSRMKSYWRAIREDGERARYAVHQVPYLMMPKGFLDEENIREAKRTMSTIQFVTEYEAAMVSDSDGFFKASMLEKCTTGSDFTIKTTGEKGKEYVLGIDPNQGGSAACGLVIVELSDPLKMVFVKGLKKNATQDMVMEIQRLCNIFNIKRIYMDSQGGGNAIKNLLEEGYNGKEPILDMDDERVKSKAGRRLLRMVNPSPNWISDANFELLAALENARVRFPMLPLSDTTMEKQYEEVKLLKSQLLNIVITKNPRGTAHFDTPKKGQNKDLYSALVLAVWGSSDLSRDNAEPEKFATSAGYARPHKPGARFRPIPGAAISGKDYMNHAVLKKTE
jgi:hypothetical protein